MKEFNLSNRRIVIVGASSGIGKQAAITLSECGANVVLIARREALLKDITSNLLQGNNAYYKADISDLDEIGDLFNKIVCEQGKIDGMVYSAGISLSAPLNLYTPSKLKEIFTINYFAFVECVRQVCKKGRYNEGMRIVGVSSVASLRGDKAHLGYSSSKAAMDAAVRCIAKEVAEKKICINTIAPGMTKTEMFENYVCRSGGGGQYDKDLERQYLGVASVDDIVASIVFLLSDSAKMITGITLPVDGGFTTC